MNFIFDPSLVLYLPLYQLDGASFMSKDAYGHLCTVTGALWRPNGRLFDGSDDYIAVAHHPNLAITGEQTIMFWGDLQPPSSGALSWHVLLGKHPGNFYDNCIAVHNTLWTMQVRHGGALGASLTYSSGWCLYTVLISSNREISTIYRGTTLESEVDIGVAVDWDNTNSLTIGNSYAGRTAEGTIGEVWIYNRLLTPQEIQHNYLATKWRYR